LRITTVFRKSSSKVSRSVSRSVSSIPPFRVADSPSFFRFGCTELLAAYTEMREEEVKLLQALSKSPLPGPHTESIRLHLINILPSLPTSSSQSRLIKPTPKYSILGVVFKTKSLTFNTRSTLYLPFGSATGRARDWEISRDERTRSLQ